MKKDGVKLIVNKKRLDGRDFDELRPIKMEIGVLKRAEGSAYLEWGDNKIIAACYGPREVHPRRNQIELLLESGITWPLFQLTIGSAQGRTGEVWKYLRLLRRR
jgi:hypothetical protein